MTTIFISDLNSPEYQAAVAIRREVFVLEQNVPESIEIDEFESSSQHFLIKLGEVAAATGRLRVKGETIKFERIATLKKFRGQGVGRELMNSMLEFAQKKYPQLTPYMHSQLEAVGFYEKLGWKPQGEVFFEANIPHKKMIF